VKDRNCRRKNVAGAAEPGSRGKRRRNDHDKELARLHVELVKYRLEVGPDEQTQRLKARLNTITHLLGKIPYREPPRAKVRLPKRQEPRGYREPKYPFKYVEERF
jgi:hypothetical protein